MLKKGFTLVELLIVIAIISTLVAMETFVYLNSQKNARDGRRKADIENVRAAIEQYRSTNNSYPPSLTFNIDCIPNGPLTDSNNNTYISPLPSDPLCQLYKYHYTALPSNCSGTSCTSYILATRLEGSTATSCLDVTITTNCLNEGTGYCNYCLGPYGQK